MAKRKKNTQEKTVVTRIIAVIFAVLFLLVLSRVVNRIANRKESNTPTPKPKQTEQRIEISGVTVNDFTKDIQNPNEELFITLSRTKDYHVFYITKEQFFFISIVSWPFDDYRLVAEADFLDKLGINEKEACNLKVYETTPAFANPDKAGKSYPLSFCQ
jgi:hypothetical protein